MEEVSHLLSTMWWKKKEETHTKAQWENMEPLSLSLSHGEGEEREKREESAKKEKKKGFLFFEEEREKPGDVCK